MTVDRRTNEEGRKEFKFAGYKWAEVKKSPLVEVAAGPLARWLPSEDQPGPAARAQVGRAAKTDTAGPWSFHLPSLRTTPHIGETASGG